MKRLFLLLSISWALAAEHEEPYFADVPPCHWAFEAVNRLGGTIFIGYPATDAYLAVNAVRQVFEGLRCEDPSWSLRFLEDAPAAFADGMPGVRFEDFELDAVLTELEQDHAEVGFTLVAIVSEAGEISTVKGRAGVLRSPDGWRVDYTTLEGLELPFFPALDVTVGPLPAPRAVFLSDAH